FVVTFCFSAVAGCVRRLHSFPPRRSSDLGIGDLRTGFLGTGTWSPDEAWATAAIEAVSASPGPAAINIRPMGGAIARVDADATADRKSTRLNASHVKISYAVFCLKKKNL